MKQVAGISVNQNLTKPQALSGALAAGIALLGGTGFALTLILLVVAASMLLSAIRVQLTITNTGGTKEEVTVSFLDKASLGEFVQGARRYMIDK